MYAIRAKKSKKWLYGTDYRYPRPHQRTSKNEALLYSDLFLAESDFKKRRCSNKLYEIVPVRLEEIPENSNNNSIRLN